MKKYMERTQQSKMLTTTQGGIQNSKISDGLNLNKAKNVPDLNDIVDPEQMMPAKRARYGAPIDPS